MTLQPSQPSLQSPLKLSVVICAHNEQDWIARTLESLWSQKRLPDELIVVNNVSTDSTERIVQRFMGAHPEWRIMLVNQPRKGLHHAREAGWRATSGDIVVMTDADVTFPVDWLANIEAAFADSTVDALTGCVRFDDALPIINWATWACDQVYQPERIGRMVTKSYLLFGNNSAYRRHVLETVGGYANKPPDLLEDVFISKRVQDAHFKIKFLRHNKIWHTFRRYSKEGVRGYLKYLFFFSPENVYADHLSDV
ncbi:MAG: glycosyltransferase family 2 protein [Chloroflexota bacterium]